MQQQELIAALMCEGYTEKTAKLIYKAVIHGLHHGPFSVVELEELWQICDPAKTQELE